MFDRHTLRDRIHQSLHRELQLIQPAGEQLFSITLPVPEIHLRTLPENPEEWFFWERPAEDEFMLGLGEVKRITAIGDNRLHVLATEIKKTLLNWKSINPGGTNFKPAAFCCLAFDPEDEMQQAWQGLPNSGLFFPELLLQQRDNCCVVSFSTDFRAGQCKESVLNRWMTLFSKLVHSLSRIPGPPGRKTTLSRIEADPSALEWLRLVEDAKSEISSGRLEKVVPARQIRVQAQRNLNPAQLISTLNYLYPSSILFAAHLGTRIFAAATPERLAARKNSTITCDAVAGTIRRAAVEQQDRDLGMALMGDQKAMHEHTLVVKTIQESLQAVCDDLKFPDRPSLIRLRNLQHLWTEITGTLKNGAGLLDVAASIHPTAAVNGVPPHHASRWLRQKESFTRGWYTGAAGWIDQAGDGELAVLLRCAVLDGDSAELFAGAGITAGSDAQAEYEETELKFGAMLEALENA